MRSARTSLAVAIAAALFGAIPGVANSAGPTHGVAVSAVILSSSNCRFNTAGPSTLAFGTIDPTGTATITASVGIDFRCGGSAAIATWAITSDDGLYESGPANPRLRHATSL